MGFFGELKTSGGMSSSQVTNLINASRTNILVTGTPVTFTDFSNTNYWEIIRHPKIAVTALPTGCTMAVQNAAVQTNVDSGIIGGALLKYYLKADDNGEWEYQCRIDSINRIVQGGLVCNVGLCYAWKSYNQDMLCAGMDLRSPGADPNDWTNLYAFVSNYFGQNGFTSQFAANGPAGKHAINTLDMKFSMAPGTLSDVNAANKVDYTAYQMDDAGWLVAGWGGGPTVLLPHSSFLNGIRIGCIMAAKNIINGLSARCISFTITKGILVPM